KLWQATSSFLSEWLLYPLIDLSRKEPARWMRNAPRGWRAALKNRALIRGVPATYDDRFYRYVWIDNTGFCLQFKYLGAGFEIAQLGPDRLLVQVGELFCSWNPLRVEGPDGAPLPVPPPSPPLTDEERERMWDQFDESGEAGGFDEIQPLGHVLAAGPRSFRSAAV